MPQPNIRRLDTKCTVCGTRSSLPVLLIAFWVQSAGYKTRLRLCWTCGYKLLRVYNEMCRAGV